MNWLLVIDLIVLFFGSLVFVHSFFINIFVNPLEEAFQQAVEEVEA